MPPISRPVVAVNALGFWMAQASSSLYPDQPPRLGVWLAQVGASKGRLVAPITGFADSIVATGSDIDVYLQASHEATIQRWTIVPVA